MEKMTMKKTRNLTVVALMILVIAIAACGSGSSGSDDNNPAPEEIYNATGDWTINALYTGDPSNPCSMFFGPSYQDVVTIEGSDDTFTITFDKGGFSVTAKKQGNTFTCSQPVDNGTEQIGTIDGKINITSDSTLEGTITVNGLYQSITCQAVYNITGKKQF
jgi:hypothetical protein